MSIQVNIEPTELTYIFKSLLSSIAAHTFNCLDPATQLNFEASYWSSIKVHINLDRCSRHLLIIVMLNLPISIKNISSSAFSIGPNLWCHMVAIYWRLLPDLQCRLVRQTLAPREEHSHPKLFIRPCKWWVWLKSIQTPLF